MEKINIKKIFLTNEKLDNLPLFFKRIFFNKTSKLDDELRLFYYDETTQSSEMRNFFPNREICKLKKIKNEI